MNEENKFDRPMGVEIISTTHDYANVRSNTERT